MMYIEFIERDRFVPVELFRYLADQESIWKEGHVDRLVLQLGRTFRFGPIPSYLAFWQIPTMERIDVWQTYFGSDEALRNRRSSAMHRGIHVQRAGLYDETVTRGPYDQQNWYLEYFDATASNESVKQLFLARAAAHSRVGLEMVKGGSDIVLLIPSRLTYGTSSQSTTMLTIPANACLKYEYYNITVTNY